MRHDSDDRHDGHDDDVDVETVDVDHRRDGGGGAAAAAGANDDDDDGGGGAFVRPTPPPPSSSSAAMAPTTATATATTAAATTATTTRETPLVDAPRSLMVFCAAALVVYLVPLKLGWTFFSIHPVLMLAAFAACAPVGLSVKRSGGVVVVGSTRLRSTMVHAYLMWASLFLTAVAWWVVHEHKERNNKRHLTSWHSWLGIALILVTLSHPILAWTWLHPDVGTRRADVRLRRWHRWLGNASMVVAFATCATGIIKLERDDAVARVVAVLTLGAMLAPFAQPAHARGGGGRDS